MMERLLTGFQVLQQVYQELSSRYNPRPIQLPMQVSLTAGIPELFEEPSIFLRYQNFGLFKLKQDAPDERSWILGIGEGTSVYAGDLAGINVNSDSVTGEQLYQHVHRFQNLSQSLIQALSSGELVFRSTLSSRLAAHAGKTLSSYMVKKGQYHGAKKKEIFDGDIETRYALETQRTDHPGYGEEIEGNTETYDHITKNLPARKSLQQRKRKLTDELPDILVKVLMQIS